MPKCGKDDLAFQIGPMSMTKKTLSHIYQRHIMDDYNGIYNCNGLKYSPFGISNNF